MLCAPVYSILQGPVQNCNDTANCSILWQNIYIAKVWSTHAPLRMLIKFLMMTSSNGNIFHVIGPLWGEVTGKFPAQRPVTRSFGVFFDLRPDKKLRKQSWGCWFETPSRSSRCHCNVSLFHANKTADLMQCDPVIIWPIIPYRKHGKLCQANPPLGKMLMKY